MLIRLFSTTIFCAVLFIAVAQSPAHGQIVLFQDDFNDGDANGWEEYSPQGEWNVENDEYVGTAVAIWGAEKPSYAVAGSKSWQDYSLQVKIKGTEGVDKEILFRVNEQGKAYILNLRSPYFGGGNDFILAKKLQIGTDLVQLLHIVPYPNSPNVWYDLRVDITNEENGVLIKAFINSALILEYLDQNDPIYNGAIGLEIWPGGYAVPVAGLRTTTHYDDILVATLPSSSLPVPDLKQFSLPWGDDTYNNASSWYPPDPSIARWGCAVTSAAMVLQYYGHATDPGELNTWLTSQPDGYIRNGLANWLSIQRYTRLQNATNSAYPILEYRRIKNADTATLSAELAAQRPVILGEHGHFVVAKGTQNSTYAINDPAHIDRPTLESYTNSFTSFGIYKPTSTNLSYLFLVVDTEVNLSVSGENTASENAYVENPLIDDIDEISTSGESLQIFELPTPEDGAYTINLSAPIPTPFTLQIYDYDTNANSTIYTIEGIADPGIPTKVNLNFTQEEGNNPPQQVITFQTTLEDIENAWTLGWISSRRVYQRLKMEIILAKWASNHGKTKLVKFFLDKFIRNLKKGHPRYINGRAYNLLLEDANALLEPPRANAHKNHPQ